jgi:hypothetical protein
VDLFIVLQIVEVQCKNQLALIAKRLLEVEITGLQREISTHQNLMELQAQNGTLKDLMLK